MKNSLTTLVLILLLGNSLQAQLAPAFPNIPAKHAQTISLSDSTDFSDLKKLGKQLKKKRIVLLGESTHGAKEMALIKNRLIRYLHQELGFKVLLFESGMGEVYSINYKRYELSTRQMLFTGLVGPWQSKEFLPLMSYLKKESDLQVAAFDLQRSGSSFNAILQKIESDVDLESELNLVQLEARFSDLRKRLISRKMKADEEMGQEQAKLITDLREAIKAIGQLKNELLAKKWNVQQLNVIIRTIQNRIDFISYYYQFKLDNDYIKRFAFRDSVMAENIIWLAEKIYPNEKLIVSAHNYHIARHNEKDSVMGEKLAEVFGDQLYAIGLFPGKGSFANNARQAEQMEHTGAATDLQSIIIQSKSPYTFLAIPKKKKKGMQWLFDPLTLNNTFVSIWGDKPVILSESFDGLIFLREISPSEYW